jgi:dGTPase
VRSSTTIDPEIRSEFERDVDRIYYNYYFRRLAEITQVASHRGPLLRHNRMTHSLKVAQVGRRLAQYLRGDGRNRSGIEAAGGIDDDVVAAAGLLHDIGHPPFGHIAEKELNELARSKDLKDGYEGNAQTLRIILSLVRHEAQRSDRAEIAYGLDLTRAVVAACVKYPWLANHQPKPAGKEDKWGYYETEKDLFEKFVAPILPGKYEPTLEANLMDWADDITYAVHDLQDFFISGAIPLHHLHRTDSDEFNKFWQYATEKLRVGSSTSLTDVRTVFESYARRFPNRQFGGSREEFAQVGRLASTIITEASKATSVRVDGRLRIKDDTRALIDALKQITWYYVIDQPNLVSTQIGQRARIKEVFDVLLAWVKKSFEEESSDGRPLSTEERWIRKRRLPTPLREFTEQLLSANDGLPAYGTEQCYTRAVIDHIASMTEFQQLHRRLCGIVELDIAV